MKFYILFTVLISLPYTIFSFSKNYKEEEKPDHIIFQSAYHDYKNKNVIYKVTPLLAQNQQNGLIKLQPYIYKHDLTGEIRMQMRVSYYPVILNKSNNYTVTIPRNLSIFSASNYIQTTLIPLKKSITIQPSSNNINKINDEFVMGEFYIFDNYFTDLNTTITNYKPQLQKLYLNPADYPTIVISNTNIVEFILSNDNPQYSFQQNYLKHKNGATNFKSMSLQPVQSVYVSLFNDTTEEKKDESITIRIEPYYLAQLFLILQYYKIYS